MQATVIAEPVLDLRETPHSPVSYRVQFTGTVTITKTASLPRLNVAANSSSYVAGLYAL
jgi:hypothetical protein